VAELAAKKSNIAVLDRLERIVSRVVVIVPAFLGGVFVLQILIEVVVGRTHPNGENMLNSASVLFQHVAEFQSIVLLFTTWAIVLMSIRQKKCVRDLEAFRKELKIAVTERDLSRYEREETMTQLKQRTDERDEARREIELLRGN
jgi:hypothetical protein